jgi:hypothetical protein
MRLLVKIQEGICFLMFKWMLNICLLVDCLVQVIRHFIRNNSIILMPVFIKSLKSFD